MMAGIGYIGRLASLCILVLMTIVPIANGDFQFGHVRNLGRIVNSGDADGSPDISADGQTLYFDSRRSGGVGNWDIWVTKRTPTGEWGEPEPLPAPVNTVYADAGPSISNDELSLYFASDRAGGYGDFDLWVSTRPTISDAWRQPQNLGPRINSFVYENHPSISADGLSLYFDGYWFHEQGYDIWVVTRATKKSPWGIPDNLGLGVNSNGVELSPNIHVGGRVLFFDSRIIDRNIWMARRNSLEDPWAQLRYLPEPVNTSDSDADPSISSDGRVLYFASNRQGGVGGQDLYEIPIIPVVDLNGDYQVDEKDLAKLTFQWGKNEPSVDIGPMPWGDGVIDAADEEVLLSYWGQEVFDPHLLAHWKMDETEGDVAYDSARGVDAKVMGNAIWQPDSGQIEGAIQLDGTASYLSASHILDPEERVFSVFTWVRGGSSGQVILSQFEGANWLMLDTQGQLKTTLKGSRRDKDLTSGAAIMDDSWHRVGLTWDGMNRVLYVDDIEVASDTLRGLQESQGNMTIGASHTLDPGTFWSGLIDDLRIYDRVVTP